MAGKRPDLDRNMKTVGSVKNPQQPLPKMDIIPPQNPGVYKSTDLKSPDKMSDSSEMFWRKTAHKVADDRPVDSEGKSTKGKGISHGAFAELRHLERHGQTSRLMGTIASPTEKIKKGFKKGWDDYLAKP
jgi:hypothetical protein